MYGSNNQLKNIIKEISLCITATETKNIATKNKLLKGRTYVKQN